MSSARGRAARGRGGHYSPSVLFFCHDEQRGGKGEREKGSLPPSLSTVFLPRRAARGGGQEGGVITPPLYCFSATTSSVGVRRALLPLLLLIYDT
jgi:hypothetical protein